MVIFKGGWSKLYYTQHTLLNNVGQLLILFFFLETNAHTRERERVDIGYLLIYIKKKKKNLTIGNGAMLLANNNPPMHMLFAISCQKLN